MDWAEGRRARLPRPSSYSFLAHCWACEPLGEPARLGPPAVGRDVRVASLWLSGQELPDTLEEEAGEEPLAVVASERDR